LIICLVVSLTLVQLQLIVELLRGYATFPQ